MSKYKRKHGNSNTSPGIFLIGGFALLGFLIWKMVDRYKTAKQIHAIEKQELENKQKAIEQAIIADSLTEKQDTIGFK